MTAESIRPLIIRLTIYLLILLAISVVFSQLSSAYLTQGNVFSILRQMSINM